MCIRDSERQAQAAQRAATVQSTLRDARLRIAGYEIVTLRAALEQAAAAATDLSSQVDAATAALEEATAAQESVETQLAAVQPQAEQAQQVWFQLSTLTERTRATERIAAERASSAGAPVPYSGQDPDELLARARVADQRQAEAEAASHKADVHLEVVRGKVAEAQAVFDAADREHMARLRAIADRREGLVRLLAQEEAHSSALQALSLIHI